MLIIHYPGVLKHKVDNIIIDTVDIMPTSGDWFRIANDRWCDEKINQSFIDY